jgi:hypothetical protein
MDGDLLEQVKKMYKDVTGRPLTPRQLATLCQSYKPLLTKQFVGNEALRFVEWLVWVSGRRTSETNRELVNEIMRGVYDDGEFCDMVLATIGAFLRSPEILDVNNHIIHKLLSGKTSLLDHVCYNNECDEKQCKFMHFPQKIRPVLRASLCLRDANRSIKAKHIDDASIFATVAYACNFSCDIKQSQPVDALRLMILESVERIESVEPSMPYGEYRRALIAQLLRSHGGMCDDLQRRWTPKRVNEMCINGLAMEVLHLAEKLGKCQR